MTGTTTQVAHKSFIILRSDCKPKEPRELKVNVSPARLSLSGPANVTATAGHTYRRKGKHAVSQSVFMEEGYVRNTQWWGQITETPPSCP